MLSCCLSSVPAAVLDGDSWERGRGAPCREGCQVRLQEEAGPDPLRTQQGKSCSPCGKGAGYLSPHLLVIG